MREEGIEPPASWVWTRRSPAELHALGAQGRCRTSSLQRVMLALSRLSYSRLRRALPDRGRHHWAIARAHSRLVRVPGLEPGMPLGTDFTDRGASRRSRHASCWWTLQESNLGAPGFNRTLYRLS